MSAPSSRAVVLELHDLKETASPRFADLVSLAREEALLEAILAHQPEAVRERALKLLVALAVQTRWAYPIIPPRNATPEEAVAAM